MSTNKTANYQLHLWEPGDDFLRKEFNENNEKLDTALKAQAEELDTAVSALSTELDTAVSTLSSEMDTAVANAKQTAASALAAYKTSNDAAVSTLSTEMNTAVANAKQTAASALAAYKTSNDAAVAEVAAGAYVTIMDVTTTSAAQQVDLDVSGIDFTQYWKVEFSLECALSDHLFLRTNNVTAGYGYSQTAYGFANLSDYMMMICNPATWAFTCKFFQPKKGSNVAIWVNQIYLGSSSGSSHDYHGISPVLWEELKTLNFYHASKSIPAGTRFVLRGLKK